MSVVGGGAGGAGGVVDGGAVGAGGGVCCANAFEAKAQVMAKSGPATRRRMLIPYARVRKTPTKSDERGSLSLTLCAAMLRAQCVSW